jgi:hypothetical protein
MKIGFCGTQCSGKTTQAGLLESKGYILVPSASRIAAEHGVPVNRQGTLSTQFVTSGITEMQKYDYAHEDKVVWQRTHVDHMAYGMTSDLSDLYDELTDCVWHLAWDMLVNYLDVVFYFPAYPIEMFQGEREDGVRDTNPRYRLLIDSHIRNILDGIGAEYYTIPQGDITEVHGFIMSSIEHATTLEWEGQEHV